MSRIFTIDLDDEGVVARFRDELVKNFFRARDDRCGLYSYELIEVIESLMSTPEPENVGTVVRSADGGIYIRNDRPLDKSAYQRTRWRNQTTSQYQRWEDLAQPVTVLSEGWDGTEPDPCSQR